MKHIAVRTEFSFRLAYGPLDKVIAAGGVGICDRNGTWGHARFSKAVTGTGIKPVFGVELPVVEDADKNERQAVYFYRFLATSSEGLRNLYKLTTLSTKQFYYHPRLGRKDLVNMTGIAVIAPENDVLRASEGCYLAITQGTLKGRAITGLERGLTPIAVCDNHYPANSDRDAYEVLAGKGVERRNSPMWLLSESEWHHHTKSLGFIAEQALCNTNTFYEKLELVELPKAKMLKFDGKESLAELCRSGATTRNIDLNNRIYSERLERELKLIKEKDFEDYFFILADLINYAKKHMFVGPARGSSCGSLVCYLLGITEIDPIPFGLLFERFIDVTREDLPDIDVDFQDNRREMVFDYLKNKYGAGRVARIGNVNRYKAASALRDTASAHGVPLWEVEGVKNAMLKRSTGDSRAQLCIADTFDEIEVGKELLGKYPEMKIASKLENHATHSSQHAAGVAITEEPISNYCSIDEKIGVAQFDKKDAEMLGILKIDALGLRTLSILQDCLDSVGKSRDWLFNYSLKDELAFKIINDRKLAGIFQFEGAALQNISRRMTVGEFEDIVSLTSLARPGPLASGSTTDFLERKSGGQEIKYLHPMAKNVTEVSLGCIIYQEQVMQLGREIGSLTWEDVSTLRKAMSKSFGKEYFDKFFEKFWDGAEKNGLTKGEAEHIWEHMNTMGSWAFNRSHAVAYGMVSYWCCVLKAHFPLEFAAACLRNAKDDDQTKKILKELVNEGYEYKPFDAKLSLENWSVQDGKLIGGLKNVKGIGNVLSKQIIEYRNSNKKFTDRMNNLLSNGTTPFDSLFEAKKLFGDYYEDPHKYRIKGKVQTILSIIESMEDQPEVCFLGKLTSKNVKDLNEAINVQKRGGRKIKGQSLTMNFDIEDDTSFIKCRINQHLYDEFAKDIYENGVVGKSWYIIRGKYGVKFNMVAVSKIRKIL